MEDMVIVGVACLDISVSLFHFFDYFGVASEANGLIKKFKSITTLTVFPRAWY